MEQYAIEGDLSRTGVARPPRSSFAHGAAGVAYFLFRHSQLSGDRRHLEAAGHWLSLAERDPPNPEAFVEPSSRVFPDGRRSLAASLHFGEAGIWCVAALVYAARREPDNVERALDHFGTIAEARSFEYLDAILGAASLLLGAAILVEGLSDPPRSSVISIGDRLAARLDSALGQPIALEDARYLGAAHGPCGVVHSLLRWCQATTTRPSPTVIESLERLASARLDSGLWPREEDSVEVWRGWCHGSAGWVQLWTLAHEVVGDPGFLDLTAQAAEHAVAADPRESGGLCCGQAGEGYAAIALYRATGDDMWLDHARRLADQARRIEVGPTFPQHSLWRGDLGVALLDLELSRPEQAAMPLYRAIG